MANEKFLSVVNERIIRAVCDWLAIPVKIQRCTEIVARDKLRHLEANQRLIVLAKALGATRYLSGPAARPYLNVDQFRVEGIEVNWMSYDGYPPYPQLWGPFEPRVSIADLLLNAGADTPRYLKRQ